MAIAKLYPAPNVNGNGFNFLSNPVRSETRNNFDVRIDQKYTDNDYAFFRFSYEDQPSLIPGPFDSTGGDGGGFFSGVEDNAYRSFATSWTHLFRSNLTNEFRLGYNRVNSQRQQINADKTSEELLNFPGGFPGIPNVPGNGGLPQLTFNDITQIGSPTVSAFARSAEHLRPIGKPDLGARQSLFQIRNRHSFRRVHDFSTRGAPRHPRLRPGIHRQSGPNAQFSGGSGFASFLVGLSDGGSINNLHNIDYHHQVYAFYAQDDWKVTPKLTLNLGLRYELFTTIKERNNELGTFDLSTGTLIVPKGVTAQLTPHAGRDRSGASDCHSRADFSGHQQFRSAHRPGLPGERQAGRARGLRHFLWRRRGRPVLQSEHGIQSAVLHQQEFQPALRRRLPPIRQRWTVPCPAYRRCPAASRRTL